MRMREVHGSLYDYPVPAQVLYDLRELTGFVSGTDLHDLFEAVLDGEPSPSGKTLLHVAALMEHPTGREAVRLLGLPMGDVLADIREYTGAPMGVEPSRRPLGLCLPHLMAVLAAEKE